MCSNLNNSKPETLILAILEKTSECKLTKEPKAMPVLQILQEELSIYFGIDWDFRIILHTFPGMVRGGLIHVSSSNSLKLAPILYEYKGKKLICQMNVILDWLSLGIHCPNESKTLHDKTMS